MSTPTRIPENDPTARKSLLLKAMHRAAQHSATTWFLTRVGTHVDPVLMRWSGGRLNVTGTRHVLILHHRGRKSGLPRETPLVYFTDGDDVVLMASNGGSAQHPAWYHNVQAHPDVQLFVGARGGDYRARVASPAERERLWSLAQALFAGYGRYQDRAGDRRIPVVICTPRAGSGQG